MEILFITYNRLGDAVLSSGLYNHLASRPEARITVACGPVPAPLFAAAPALAGLIELKKQPRLGHWRRLWARTAFRRWDLVVDLRGSALAWLVPARARRVLRPAPRPMHKVRRLAGLLGLAEPPAPRLWTTPAQDDQAATLLPGDGPVLALGPTANWVGKQWPGERFAELACRLTAAEGILPGARIAVFGAPHERDLARQALDGLPAERRIDLVGRVDLPTLYACLRRCRLFIGNDSGLMHMAAAAGIPTLGLFGPSRDEIYGPWSPLAAVVRTERSFEDIVHDPGFDHRSGACHMLDLSVERAEAATLALWRRVAAEAA